MEPPHVASLLLLLLISAAATATAFSISADGLRVDLTRVDSTSNFTKLQQIQRAARRSHHRLTRTKLATDRVETTVHAGTTEFLMDLAIGTPAKPYTATLDTGSDLIWTQCQPCIACFQQPSPIFDPSSSSSFAKLPCSGALCKALSSSSCNTTDCEYDYPYGGGQSTQGSLASETFTFGSTAVSGIAFGCGNKNQGVGFGQSSGLVGLGRGPLSLASQLGLGKFSYCFTSFGDTSKKSPLFLGSMAALDSTATVQSTPLSKNPINPSLYYLNLTGITVGNTLLDIPRSAFAVQQDGTGGVIIDSGSPYTYLETTAYQLVKAAFVSQTNLSVADGSGTGLDLCFSLAAPETTDVPKLVFHFDGADVDLRPENYMVGVELDSGKRLSCLTMLESIAALPVSIFGNYQQQNIQILYDLDQETLSFMSVQCDQL